MLRNIAWLFVSYLQGQEFEHWVEFRAALSEVVHQHKDLLLPSPVDEAVIKQIENATIDSVWVKRIARHGVDKWVIRVPKS